MNVFITSWRKFLLQDVLLRVFCFSEVDSLDDIIRKGEEKTEHVLRKYQNSGIEDLQRFTTESTNASSYEWEGEDYRLKVGRCLFCS